MRISCSRAQTISTCGRLFKYKYEERLSTLTLSLALVFGRAIDVAVSGYVANHALGKSFDLKGAFDVTLEEGFATHDVQYPQHWDATTAREAGRVMCDQFPEVWEKANLVAVIDSRGTPIVQRRLIVPLSHGHELEMVIDAVVMDLLGGEIGVLDFKTTSQSLSPESPFGYNALQLTTYQYGVDAALSRYLGPVSNTGFMELVKRKPATKATAKGPTVEAPRFYPRRTKEQISDMVKTYLGCIRDINERRFNRPTNAAFNNPCDLCDFARLCVHNDRQGIIPRPARRAA